MKYIGYTVAGIFALFLTVFILNGIGLINYSFYAPKTENVRRKVFENTQSYVEGKRQELTKYRLEYKESKDTASKEAIKETILQSFANFDESKLPPDLQSFLQSLKNE